MVTVLLLHPKRLVREVWASYLAARDRIRVLAAADNLAEGVKIVANYKPRVTIIASELVFPGGKIELADLQEVSRNTRLIVVTGDEPPEMFRQMHAPGVSAILSKDARLSQLDTTIADVDAGLRLMPERPSTVNPQLTRREIEIIRLLTVGKTSREIAGILNTSYRTVEVQRASLLKKMGCRKTSELLLRAELELYLPGLQH